MTPMKAIRSKCLDCCCGSAPQVRQCTITGCPLFPYRFGHRPKSNLSAPPPDFSGGAEANCLGGYTDIPQCENTDMGCLSRSITANQTEREVAP